MSPLTTSDAIHEAECAEAAYALLIERAKTHTERKRLIAERSAFRRKINEAISK